MPDPAPVEQPQPFVEQPLMHAAQRAAVGLEGRKVTEGLKLSAGQEAVVKAALEQVKVNQGRKALETIAGTDPDKATNNNKLVEFEYGNWEDRAKGIIYTDFKPNGERIARLGSTEEQRMGSVKEAMKTYDEFIKHGYDGLKDTLGGLTAYEKQEILRDKIESFLKATPTIAESLKISGRIPREAIENLLRDEKLRSKLAEILNTRFKDLPEDDKLLIEDKKIREAEAEKAKIEVKRLRAKQVFDADPTDSVKKATFDAVEMEIKVKDHDIFAAKIKFNKEVLERQTKGGIFSQGVERALFVAAQQATAARTKEFIDNYHSVKDQAITAAVKEHKDQVDGHVKDRWIRNGKRWIPFLGRRIEVNKGQIRKDMGILLREGPDSLVKDTVAKAGISESQAVLMMEDNTFMEAEREEMIVSLLASHIGSGGKLSKGQLEAIAFSSWGEKALQNVFSRSDEYQARRQQLIDKGLQNPTPGDILKHFGRGVFLNLLVKPMRLIRRR